MQKKGDVQITIGDKTLFEEGAYYLGIFEPNYKTIGLSDSLNILYTNDSLVFYTFIPDSNTVVTFNYYEQEGSDGSAVLGFISPFGTELLYEGLNTFTKSFTLPVKKDSTYLIEIDPNTTCSPIFSAF